MTETVITNGRWWTEIYLTGDISGIIALTPALKFNGGGHINHSIFWETLAPGGQSPSGDLLEAIEVYERNVCSKSNLRSSAAMSNPHAAQSKVLCRPV